VDDDEINDGMGEDYPANLKDSKIAVKGEEDEGEPHNLDSPDEDEFEGHAYYKN
jgi:hypothetical protein